MKLSDLTTWASRTARAAIRTLSRRPEDVPTWGQPGSEFGPPRPLTATAIKREYDLPYSYAIGAWSVDECRAAIMSQATGTFRGVSLLWTEMTTDAYLDAVLNTRALGLLSRDMLVKPNPLCRSKRRAAMAADMFRERVETILDVGALTYTMRTSEGLGCSTSQVVWAEDEGVAWPSLQVWPEQYIYYRSDLRTLVTTTMDGQVTIEPGTGQWFLYTPHMSSAHRCWEQSSVRCLWLPWISCAYSNRDQSRFNEVHGLPIRKLKVPATEDERTKQAIFEAVQSLGSEASFLLPQGADRDNPGLNWDLELVEATSPSWQSMDNFVQRCQRLYAIRCLNQNLTTEVDAGSLASTVVHDQVRLTIVRSDNKKLSRAIHEQIVKPWARFAFDGDETCAPIVCWDVDPATDIPAKAQALASIGQAVSTLVQAGAPVDMAALLRQFEIPVSEQPTAPPEPEGESAGDDGPSRVDVAVALKGAGANVDMDAVARDEGLPISDKPAADAAPATMALASGDFDEAKHPRSDDGKFGSGSGGSKPAAKPAAKPKISWGDDDDDDAPAPKKGVDRFREKAQPVKGAAVAKLEPSAKAVAKASKQAETLSKAMSPAERKAISVYTEGRGWDAAIKAHQTLRSETASTKDKEAAQEKIDALVRTEKRGYFVFGEPERPSKTEAQTLASLDKRAKAIDGAFAKAKEAGVLDTPRTLYRGMVADDRVIAAIVDAHEHGRSFNSFDSVMSTSLSPKVAARFSSDGGDEGHGVVLAIKSKSGMPIMQTSHHDDQHEILTHKSMKLKITALQHVDDPGHDLHGKMIVHLEEQ